jgi:cardiolipin synthase
MAFGFDGRRHKAFNVKAKMDERIYDEFFNMKMQDSDFVKKRSGVMDRSGVIDIKDARYLDEVVYLNHISGNAEYSEDNEIGVFFEGEEKFESLVEDIRAAKDYIHMQYYIVRNDALSREIMKELARKAAEGLEVRFLFDGMGCVLTPKKLFKPLTDAGGQAAVFLPPHFVRLNYRNHRKIAVIDGHIGYIGGLNIGSEYLGRSKRFGHWRDAHIKIDGEAVHYMETRFMMDWNFSSGNSANIGAPWKRRKLAPFPAPKKATLKREGSGVRGERSAGDKMPFNSGYYPRIQKKAFSVGAQIVSSGPDTKWPAVQYAYEKMILKAYKSVYVQTPYFIPGDSVMDALRVAALSGVDVRIMIPARPDHPFVYWAGLSYLSELLDAGAKCYQYENGFLHSKFMVLDSLASSIGTSNMDVRSFRLNFEINAFIYSHRIAAELEERFLKDIDDCTEISPKWYAGRSRVTRAKEAVSRLLSPIL